MNGTFTGQGVNVAVLDSGIYPHIDFDNRIIAFKDFINNRTKMYDDNGHGTHVAGVIAGSGRASLGRIKGVAPKAGIVAVKVLSADGTGNSVDAMNGIQWILDNRDRYKIRIVNISIGTAADDEDNEESVFVKAVERLWDEGIVVVAAAGNNGPDKGSVTAPGISRKVITVGSVGEMTAKGKFGRIKKYYSGHGPTRECIMKPEIVADGSRIMSCGIMRDGYTAKSGTSMAVAYISGMIALLLQKYPDMQPKDVKLRLHDRAVDINLPKHIQGWGTIEEKSFLN